MTPVVYPAGPITTHGAYYLLKGTHPEVRLAAHDGSVVFYLMGGRSIADPTRPERVVLKNIKGLVPPWKTVDQKGATEDGVTFLDALYDPVEIDMGVVCRGRDAKHARKVLRHLIDSIDVKETSELSWFTPELGLWWSDVRWFKSPPDEINGAQKCRQPLSLTLRGDNGFWRSFDDVDQFRFTYKSAADDFNYTTSEGLSPSWETQYSGPGGGYLRVANGEVVWVDDPRRFFTQGRTVVCRRAAATATNNQVVEVQLGSFPEWSFPQSAYNDIWGRMPGFGVGTPGNDGVRLRVGFGQIILSYFVAGTEHVLRQSFIRPPQPGEIFTLICGFENEPRIFKALRNGAEIMTVKEAGSGSLVGSGYRSFGFGEYAAGAAITQATPASIRAWSAGDNSTATESGFLTRINFGDQPRFDRYTCFGPGKFSIADGPGSTEFVTFGPLLPGQVMQIRTDPRARGVVDLTSVPSTPQQQTLYTKALADLQSFASANNSPQLLSHVSSAFGVTAPQGNPYTLLSGRFSRPIPPKLAGKPAAPVHIACSIEGGNADSLIIAAGTPLRRFPI